MVLDGLWLGVFSEEPSVLKVVFGGRSAVRSLSEKPVLKVVFDSDL